MKSRDSYELFEVFKPGYMDGATFFEKFRYWFKEVYWYHFKFHTLGAILLIVFVFALAGDIVSREYNDLDFILGGSVFAESEQMEELSDYMGGFIKEDGTAKVGRQMLCTSSSIGTGDTALALDEFAATNINKITVSFADDEILLFLLDKKYTDWYNAQGAFEPLSTFGIESENECFVRVDNTEIIKKLGIRNESGIYAAIKVITPSRSEKKRIAQKYENAGLALRGMLGQN